jgi:hypothetical protein
MSLQGSCLCRAVRYEIAQLDGAIVHCHCNTCRKANASPFTSTARVAKTNFRWLSGEDLLGGYESSPGKVRRFCASCGSHVVAERPDQPYVILRVATLDDDPARKPAMPIWASHDVAWLATDNVPSFAEIPPAA